MTVQMSRRRAQDASLSDATGASPYRLARPADPLLRLDKISRHFGKLRAVNEGSFEMASGELRAVIGPNGAGKTTFFNLISGLHAPTSGRVWFAGKDVTSVPIVKRVALGIVRTFQITEIFPELSVFENIRLGVETAAKVNAKPWVSRKTRAALDRRLNELIEIVDLADKRENLVGELAHGDQRVVEVAIALSLKPRLLLLDEPTVGLDIKSRADILGHVRRLLQSGIGVLWATHLIDEVGDNDDVVVLHGGRVLAKGAVSDVVAATGTPEIGSAFTTLHRVPG